MSGCGGRFKITANQVTIARILALPFPCWALIARPEGVVLWLAFASGVILGATDFVDGYMARRDGPTVLGGLLDPVADKLFMAVLLLPLVAHNECPAWAAGALFTRELLITALRTSMAIRHENLKTSQLGKLKTVAQMGGLMTFFITVFAPHDVMPWIQLSCFGGMFALMVAWTMRVRGTPPVWLMGGTVLWGLVAALAFTLPPYEAGFWQFIMMVALTWISGGDYLFGAWQRLRKGGVRAADVTRALWSFAHGLALIPLVEDHFGMLVPTILSLSFELALGGIDNIVAAERGRLTRTTFLVTATFAGVISVLGWTHAVSEPWLVGLTWALAAFSGINATIAFILEREVFFSESKPLAA